MTQTNCDTQFLDLHPKLLLKHMFEDAQDVEVLVSPISIPLPLSSNRSTCSFPLRIDVAIFCAFPTHFLDGVGAGGQVRL